MRFQLLSDLHLEFCKNIPQVIPHAPYLLLAGDIGYPENPLFTQLLKDVSTKFKCVFFTPGNHEYYQHHKSREERLTMSQLDDAMHNACATYHNVVYLNKTTYDLEDIRLIGATLWSKVNKNDNIINDYASIYPNDNHDTLTIDDTLTMHEDHRIFIANAIRESPTRCIVMSHHLPSKHMVTRSLAQKFPRYISHFASDLDHMLDPEYVAAWVCGHSHAHVVKEINGVPCYLNAVGYPKEEYRGALMDFTFSV